MKKLDVRAVRNGKEWREVKSIRTKVFIEEQECEPRQEWDEYETSSRQMIGLLGGKPVATARWRTVWHEERRVAKLERFAVLKEYRGKGYGRSLVEQVMTDARMAGRRDFLIHAQQHLEDFYRSFGFETVGEPFEEAGIPHVKMVRLA
ncbi:MAG: GNAT family N-acetyltransferase [Rhodothermales bacterium]